MEISNTDLTSLTHLQPAGQSSSASVRRVEGLDSISSPELSYVLSSSIEDSSDSEAENIDLLNPLEQLQRICNSERFNLNESSSSSTTTHNRTTKSKNKSKKSRKRARQRNKYLVKSFSIYYTEENFGEEEFGISIAEQESPQEIDDSSQELLQNWEKHWAEHGENILWRTWNEKYKEYINPDYDLVDLVKNMPLYSDSSSSSGDESQKNVSKMKMDKSDVQRDESETSLKRKVNEHPTGVEGDKLWQETWDNHCHEEYTAEYQKYVKKHIKMRKCSSDDAQCNPRIRKYWAQRYYLFSKYDEGIKLDFESWFSVTPEKIAAHIADKICKAIGPSGVILDAFCGCGGNTIQFAMRCDKVIAVDIDPVKIENCKHNARIYGVEDKIEFIVGDFMELAEIIKADAVFLSPPWGGPAYQCPSVFDIDTMIPMNGSKLFKTTKTISDNIAYFLPRNVNNNQVMKLAGEGNYVEIERNLHNDKIKTMTAYYGKLTRLPIKKVSKK